MVSPRTSKSLITISSTTIHSGLINNNNNNNGSYNKINKNYHYQQQEAEINNTTNSNNSSLNNDSYSSAPAAVNSYLRQQHEVFIGNLKAEKPTMSLISNLQELFKSVGITVALFQFTLCHRRGNNARKYAFVLLSNEREEKQLCTLHETEGLDFVITGLSLIVTKRKSLYHRETKKSRVTFDGRRYLECRPSKSDTAISEISCDHMEMMMVGGSDDDQQRPMTNDNGTCYQKVLYYGQNLPAEDRVTEYKRGSGNYIKHMLIPHIRKYVCAFLNSEGGRLMIGVDNECRVCGISCTRKQEDIARCQIDNTIKHFQPHVLPNMYMIDFIPVKLSPQDNIELESVDPLLKVLEVSVNKQKLVNCLYETDKEKIYIRRDGSVEGPLKTSQIVEWCRVNFTKIISPDSNDSEFCSNCSPKRITLNIIATDQQQFLRKLEETIASSQKHLESALDKLQKELEGKDVLVLQQLKTQRAAAKRRKDTDVRTVFNYCNIL